MRRVCCGRPAVRPTVGLQATALVVCENCLAFTGVSLIQYVGAQGGRGQSGRVQDPFLLDSCAAGDCHVHGPGLVGEAACA